MTRKPDYQRNGVTLYRGDCADVLQTLEAGSVGAIITDPPYNYGKDYGTHFDAMPWNEYIAWLTSRFQRASDVLRDGGVVYFTCSTQMMRLVEDWPFLRFRQWLIWHRPNIINVHSHSDWKQDWEPIYYGGKGSFRTLKGVFPDTAVFRVPAPQSTFREGRQHVCQRPIELLRRIISRVDADVVCDPFTGSGTTGLACIRTGRRFIGVEIDERYFKVAVDRIEREFARHPLFAEEEESVA